MSRPQTQSGNVTLHLDGNQNQVTNSDDALYDLRDINLKLTALPTTKGVPRHVRFNDHLQALRVQREYTSYQIIRTYFAKAQQSAEHDGISAPKSTPGSIPHDTPLTDSPSMNKAQRDLDDANARTRHLVSRLELALVKARQELAAEKTTLEKVRAQSVQGADFDAGVRRHALETARDELQSWIEDGLSRAETAREEHGGGSTNGTAGEEQRELDAEIAAEYERYVEARKRVLRAADALRRPLQAVERAAAAPVKSRARTLTLDAQETEMRFSVAAVEKHGMLQYQNDKLVEHYAQHVGQEDQKHRTRLLQTLNLLRHESHLLANHPPPGLETGFYGADGDDESKILDLLQAWKSASQSAGFDLEETVANSVEASSTALSDAERKLADLRLLEDMKEQVLQGMKT